LGTRALSGMVYLGLLKTYTWPSSLVLIVLISQPLASIQLNRVWRSISEVRQTFVSPSQSHRIFWWRSVSMILSRRNFGPLSEKQLVVNSNPVATRRTATVMVKCWVYLSICMEWTRKRRGCTREKQQQQVRFSGEVPIQQVVLITWHHITFGQKHRTVKLLRRNVGVL